MGFVFVRLLQVKFIERKRTYYMMHRNFLLLWLMFILPSATLHSQSERNTHPNSPVFKNYRPPTTAPLLEQSDVTYQMWQGFRVQQEANAGDAVSQFELSIRYLTGRGFRADTVKAAYWTKKAADQNHLLARYNLGIFQFNGWGTPWNPFDSFKNFLFAAERNMADARYVLAQFFTENLVVPRNMNEAYKWIKLAADSGYAPAKETLKEFESRGYHVPSDSNQPAESGSTATTQYSQNSGAIQLLFLNFSTDTAKTPADSVLLEDALKTASLERNDKSKDVFGSVTTKAGELRVDSAGISGIQNAANAGSPEALVLLARCYEKGVGAQKDVVLAAMNYVRAVRFDSPRAGRLLYNLIQDKTFFEVLRHLVNHNDQDAQYVWAGLVSLGFDQQLTEAQAFQMLVRAASHRHPQAMIELGLCYYSGRWTKRDERKAEELWRQASSLGSTEAAVRLAVLKIRGKRKDAASAVAIVREAAAKGSLLAEFALGYCYEIGLGVPGNKAEATRLYRNAGQRGSQDAFRALERMHDEIRPKEKRFQLNS
jgi:uncharacterized protein